MLESNPLNGVRFVEYFVSVPERLESMRREAVPREIKYLERVVGFARMASGHADADPAPSTPKGPRRLPAPVRRVFRVLSAAMRAIAVMPAMFIQAMDLARVRPSPSRKAIVLAIASNRLPFTEGIESPRANLAQLGRSLGDRSDEPVAAAILQAGTVLLFDPLPLSLYWSRHRKCRAEQVFIIDGAFLAVFLMVQLVVTAGKTVASLADFRRAARQTVAGTSARLRLATLCCAVAGAYDAVLDRVGRLSAVFFTCNSLLTELLRVDLIGRPACDRIDEIMHGVGERSGERFFAALLTDGRHFGASDKHGFIPQVPNLPLVGVHGTLAAHDGSLAINAYLNRYFCDQLATGRTARELIETECAKIVGCRTFTRPPFIITMFGNFSSWDAVETTSFGAERMLIDRVRSLTRRLDRESIFIYVPHPLQPAALLTPAVLGGDDIVVYSKSIFCWLVSDACLSLVSSALWEGAYFGARAFTPLLPSDGIFTDEYLKLLSHPEGPSMAEFDRALDEFVTTAVRDERKSPVAKAHARVRLMLGSDLDSWACIRISGSIPRPHASVRPVMTA